MKWYIRHYDEKHWYNFLLEGKIFFRQKKFGFYAMRESPVIYLSQFADNVKSITILSKDKRYTLNAENSSYYEVKEGDVIEIAYSDNTTKKATVIYNTILNSYFYV